MVSRLGGRPNLALNGSDVISEIYWRSHAPDTNGDGIGDCRGLIEVLPVVREIGFTAAWLPPFFRNPGKYLDGVWKSQSVDAGYDVTDYFSVDPVFGDLDDVVNLLTVAKACDLKLLIDIVPCHTSDQHPYFQDALRDPKSEFRSWYVFQKSPWREARPPTNACSVFATDPHAAGSAWSPNPHRPGEWYLHQFSPQQPQLNGSNYRVQTYFAAVLNYWADIGFAGARIDAAKSFAVHTKVRTHDHPFVDRTNERPSRRWQPLYMADAHDERNRNLSAIALGNVVRQVRQIHPTFYACHESNDLLEESLDEYARNGLDSLDMVRRGHKISIGYVPPDSRQIAATIQHRLLRARDGVRVVGFDQSHDLPNWAVADPRWIGDPTSPDQARLRQLMAFLMLSPSGAPVILYGVPLGNGVQKTTKVDFSEAREASRVPINWGAGSLLQPPEQLRPARGWEASVFYNLQDSTSYLNYVRGLMALRRTVDEHSTLEVHAAANGVVDYSIGPVRITANVGRGPQKIDSTPEGHRVGFEQGLLGDVMEGSGLRISWERALRLDQQLTYSSQWNVGLAEAEFVPAPAFG